MGRKTVLCSITVAFLMALTLSACEKTEKTTAVAPAPAVNVPVPGPAGPAGGTGAMGAPGHMGNTGATGERGKTGGDTMVVVPPPAR